MIHLKCPQCGKDFQVYPSRVGVGFCSRKCAGKAGNILAQSSPSGFAAIYFDSKDSRKFSLRSVGDVDVAKIAERYGGGGHRNASGFTVPLGWEGDKID